MQSRHRDVDWHFASLCRLADLASDRCCRTSRSTFRMALLKISPRSQGRLSNSLLSRPVLAGLN
jgi:hypothetical protein